MNKIIFFGVSGLLLFLLLFGCTQSNGIDLNTLGRSQVDINNQNGVINNIENGVGEVVELYRGDVDYKIKLAIQGGINSNNLFTKYVTKDNARVDIETQEGVAKIVSTPLGDYMCGLDKESNKWACFDYSTFGGVSMGGAFATFPSVLDMEKNFSVFENQVITPSSSRVIAGENTTCFKEKISQEQIEFCLNKRGILFYSETYEQGEKIIISAIEYSEDPISDETFALPGEIITMPTIPQMPDGYEEYMQNQ